MLSTYTAGGKQPEIQCDLLQITSKLDSNNIEGKFRLSDSKHNVPSNQLF